MDVSGIINIMDITDVVDIATDIADIVVKTNRRVQGVTGVSYNKI